MKQLNLSYISTLCFISVFLSFYSLNAQSLTLNMFKAEVSCAGMTDGNVGVEVIGGIEPYEYLWSTGATTSTIGNLGPGTYTVTVTDSNNTIENNGTFLQELEPIKVELEAFDGMCGNLGKIESTVTGGIGPFQYLWSNDKFETEIRNLEEGEYSVTVTDRGRCDISASASVMVFGDGLSLSQEFTNPSCVDASDGSILISQTGGQMPINYSWTDGREGDSLEDLSAGSYSVSAEDALGCTDGVVIILRDPDALEVEVINQNNSLFAKVEGGNPAYDYKWSNGVMGSAVISNLEVGEYFVTVTDENDCEAIDRGDVLGPLSSKNISQIESFQMSPTIVQDELNIRLQLLQSETVSFDIFSPSGQLVYHHSLSGQDIQHSFNNISYLHSGLFYLQISSESGWSFTDRFIKY